ncbi:MAG: hypothetical protein IJE84_02095, partial [Clostridia bacterium]|nr:hypothetical protein [Clostridia bacterium]
MKLNMKKIVSVLLCLVLLVGAFPMVEGHYHSGYEHQHDIAKHKENNEHAVDGGEHGHGSLLSLCGDALEAVFRAFALPVCAAYEDGVECEYCGGYRYDDWLCDDGDHCGEGADGSCYEEHHCGECGKCEEDNGLCDDCGNCIDDCCTCEEKCRGCYEIGETVCSDCGEKCTGCADWICEDCEKCPDCAGNEAYCSYCDICLNCADWICYCGDGCGNCALGCEDCYEKCTKCEPDQLCLTCMTCIDCVGGENHF